jgi:catechol 2,3-dioxygenase-like lactoylglutathione lyase family enzyme
VAKAKGGKMEFEFSPYVAFQVKDYAKAVKFYKDVLGFEVVKDGDAETHFKKGPLNFFAENSDKGSTFFEFKVSSVAEARKLLESEGCYVTQEYSAKSIMIADPYGMKFHIWEE